ncbi:unnamed protein product [Paramecium octaurelia]|uniref:Transmembrane protein n=1 Tax=Paramecium octaurelia TaxID=43137 RepID=A0A8S1SVD1_PAROT|nr:unnamed protein product [Paramecium octaurelia]
MMLNLQLQQLTKSKYNIDFSIQNDYLDNLITFIQKQYRQLVQLLQSFIDLQKYAQSYYKQIRFRDRLQSFCLYLKQWQLLNIFIIVLIIYLKICLKLAIQKLKELRIKRHISYVNVKQQEICFQQKFANKRTTFIVLHFQFHYLSTLSYCLGWSYFIIIFIYCFLYFKGYNCQEIIDMEHTQSTRKSQEENCISRSYIYVQGIFQNKLLNYTVVNPFIFAIFSAEESNLNKSFRFYNLVIKYAFQCQYLFRKTQSQIQQSQMKKLTSLLSQALGQFQRYLSSLFVSRQTSYSREDIVSLPSSHVFILYNFCIKLNVYQYLILKNKQDCHGCAFSLLSFLFQCFSFLADHNFYKNCYIQNHF